MNIVIVITDKFTGGVTGVKKVWCAKRVQGTVREEIRGEKMVETVVEAGEEGVRRGWGGVRGGYRICESADDMLCGFRLAITHRSLVTGAIGVEEIGRIY